MTSETDGTRASAPTPEGTEGAVATAVKGDAASAPTEPMAIAPSDEDGTTAGGAPATATQPPSAPSTGTEPADDVPASPGPSGGAAPVARRRDRALGTTGQVAAVVGIVVSIALIVGVLLGRGWLLGKVDDLSATIDGGLARGVPLLDNASAKVSEVSGRVGALADAANAMATNPNPAPGLSEALAAQMGPISDRYLALRASYTNVRTTVGSALDRLNTLDQMLPWLSIPQGPTDALATLDARVQEIDSTVTDLLATPGAGAVQAAAAAIATKATNVEARLASVSTAIDDANARLAALRVNVQDKAGQAKLLVTLVSVVLILGLLYSAFLHWVLFRASSGRRRKPATV